MGNSYAITKEDFKDLNLFLKTNNLIDENELWVAGLRDGEFGYNPISSNIFGLNKNLQFIIIKNNLLYLYRISEKMFIEQLNMPFHEIKKVSIQKKLFPRCIIKYKDVTYKLAITRNKKQLKEIIRHINTH